MQSYNANQVKEVHFLSNHAKEMICFPIFEYVNNKTNKKCNILVIGNQTYSIMKYLIEMLNHISSIDQEIFINICDSDLFNYNNLQQLKLLTNKNFQFQFSMGEYMGFYHGAKQNDFIISLLPEQNYIPQVLENLFNVYVSDIKPKGTIIRIRNIIKKKWFHSNSDIYKSYLMQELFNSKYSTETALCIKNLLPIYIFTTRNF